MSNYKVYNDINDITPNISLNYIQLGIYGLINYMVKVGIKKVIS